MRDVERICFLSDAGWSRLDNLFTSEKFVSLRKVVLSLVLERDALALGMDTSQDAWEEYLTLPYVNALFPMFRSLADTHQVDTQRTLETHFEVI